MLVIFILRLCWLYYFALYLLYFLWYHWLDHISLIFVGIFMSSFSNIVSFSQFTLLLLTLISHSLCCQIHSQQITITWIFSSCTFESKVTSIIVYSFFVQVWQKCWDSQSILYLILLNHKAIAIFHVKKLCIYLIHFFVRKVIESGLNFFVMLGRKIVYSYVPHQETRICELHNCS